MKSKEQILQDCETWPKKWMYAKKDILYGEAILNIMKPFIEHLLAKKLSDTTIRRHLGHLFLLGGEIIRDVNLYGEHKKISPDKKMQETLGPDDGPLCSYLDTEQEQRSFDSTCVKLYKFLNKEPSRE